MGGRNLHCHLTLHQHPRIHLQLINGYISHVWKFKCHQSSTTSRRSHKGEICNCGWLWFVYYTHWFFQPMQPKQTTPNVAMKNKGSYTHLKIQNNKTNMTFCHNTTHKILLNMQNMCNNLFVCTRQCGLKTLIVIGNPF